MRFRSGRLAMAMAAGSLVVVPSVNTRLTQTIGTRGLTQQAPVYGKDTREFYMSADDLGFIRPGFHITVNSITIPEDRRPLVDYSFTDDFHQPLDRNGEFTPGNLSINQVLAWWDADARHYTAYTTRVQTSPITGNSATQAAADSGGTWTDLEIGHSTYKFKTVLPEGYDVTKTHTLAVYATRKRRRLHRQELLRQRRARFPSGRPGRHGDLGQDDECRLQRVPRSPIRARRLAAGCQALRHLPPAADGGSGHRKHRRHEGHGPQDPHGLFAPERRSGNALHHHRQQPVGPRLLGRRVPAGHPQLRALPHARGNAVERLVHVPVPRGVRLLSRQHRLGDGREPSGGSASERRRLRVVPPAGRLPRI